MKELIQYKYFGLILKHTSTKKNLCVYRNIFIQPPVVAGRVNRGQGARPWLVVANWNMIAMSISSCILILPAEVRGRRHRN